MPTYDYACKTCGKRFEYFQSIKDDAFKECPADICEQTDPALKGHGQVTRLISKGAGFILTGEGFYETDYVRSRKQGDPDSAKKDAPKSNGDSSKGDSGSSSSAGGPGSGAASTGGGAAKSD